MGKNGVEHCLIKLHKGIKMEINIENNGVILKKSKSVEYINIPESTDVIKNIVEHIDIYTPEMNIDTIDCVTCKDIAKELWSEELTDAYKSKYLNK